MDHITRKFVHRTLRPPQIQLLRLHRWTVSAWHLEIDIHSAFEGICCPNTCHMYKPPTKTSSRTSCPWMRRCTGNIASALTHVSGKSWQHDGLAMPLGPGKRNAALPARCCVRYSDSFCADQRTALCNRGRRHSARSAGGHECMGAPLTACVMQRSAPPTDSWQKCSHSQGSHVMQTRVPVLGHLLSHSRWSSSTRGHCWPASLPAAELPEAAVASEAGPWKGERMAVDAPRGSAWLCLLEAWDAGACAEVSGSGARAPC